MREMRGFSFGFALAITSALLLQPGQAEAQSDIITVLSPNTFGNGPAGDDLESRRAKVLAIQNALQSGNWQEELRALGYAPVEGGRFTGAHSSENLTQFDGNFVFKNAGTGEFIGVRPGSIRTHVHYQGENIVASDFRPGSGSGREFDFSDTLESRRDSGARQINITRSEISDHLSDQIPTRYNPENPDRVQELAAASNWRDNREDLANLAAHDTREHWTAELESNELQRFAIESREAAAAGAERVAHHFQNAPGGLGFMGSNGLANVINNFGDIDQAAADARASAVQTHIERESLAAAREVSEDFTALRDQIPVEERSELAAYLAPTPEPQPIAPAPAAPGAPALSPDSPLDLPAPAQPAQPPFQAQVDQLAAAAGPQMPSIPQLVQIDESGNVTAVDPSTQGTGSGALGAGSPNFIERYYEDPQGHVYMTSQPRSGGSASLFRILPDGSRVQITGSGAPSGVVPITLTGTGSPGSPSGTPHAAPSPSLMISLDGLAPISSTDAAALLGGPSGTGTGPMAGTPGASAEPTQITPQQWIERFRASEYASQGVPSLTGGLLGEEESEPGTPPRTAEFVLSHAERDLRNSSLQAQQHLNETRDQVMNDVTSLRQAENLQYFLASGDPNSLLQPGEAPLSAEDVAAIQAAADQALAEQQRRLHIGPGVDVSTNEALQDHLNANHTELRTAGQIAEAQEARRQDFEKLRVTQLLGEEGIDPSDLAEDPASATAYYHDLHAELGPEGRAALAEQDARVRRDRQAILDSLPASETAFQINREDELTEQNIEDIADQRQSDILEAFSRDTPFSDEELAERFNDPDIERDVSRLRERFDERRQKIEDELSGSEKVNALHDLEADYNERFDELAQEVHDDSLESRDVRGEALLAAREQASRESTERTAGLRESLTGSAGGETAQGLTLAESAAYRETTALYDGSEAQMTALSENSSINDNYDPTKGYGEEEGCRISSNDSLDGRAGCDQTRRLVENANTWEQMTGMVSQGVLNATGQYNAYKAATSEGQAAALEAGASQAKMGGYASLGMGLLNTWFTMRLMGRKGHHREQEGNFKKTSDQLGWEIKTKVQGSGHDWTQEQIQSEAYRTWQQDRGAGTNAASAGYMSAYSTSGTESESAAIAAGLVEGFDVNRSHQLQFHADQSQDLRTRYQNLSNRQQQLLHKHADVTQQVTDLAGKAKVEQEEMGDYARDEAIFSGLKLASNLLTATFSFKEAKNLEHLANTLKAESNPEYEFDPFLPPTADTPSSGTVITGVGDGITQSGTIETSAADPAGLDDIGLGPDISLPGDDSLADTAPVPAGLVPSAPPADGQATSPNLASTSTSPSDGVAATEDQKPLLVGNTNPAAYGAGGGGPAVLAARSGGGSGGSGDEAVLGAFRNFLSGALPNVNEEVKKGVEQQILNQGSRDLAALGNRRQSLFDRIHSAYQAQQARLAGFTN